MSTYRESMHIYIFIDGSLQKPFKKCEKFHSENQNASYCVNYNYIKWGLKISTKH